MPLLLLILGFVDLLAGFALLQPAWFSLGWMQLLGWAMLLKGLYSVGTAYINKIYCDVLGWIDLIAAAVLFGGWAIPLFWVLPLAKGSYSLLAAYAGGHR